MSHPRVTAATIMYGDRWKFLSQVIEAALKDPHIVHMVIVDNGAAHPEQLREGVAKYGDKVSVISTGKNLGSAGGFAVAIDAARKTDADFILLLDDDSVPQEGITEAFMNVYRLFPSGHKVVLSASREDVLDNKEFFYRPTLADDTPRGTFFEVFSVRKLLHFSKLLWVTKKKSPRRGPFVPVIPSEGFVYGGAFIPIEAARQAALPDASLFLYGDDVAYSWGVRRLGYSAYVCSVPKLHDVDLTFGAGGSHIFSQFEKTTAPFKVYFRMRNMVYLSRKHSYQGKISLLLNVLVWLLGLYILGFTHYGATKTYWSRVLLLAKATYAGYFRSSKLARSTEASFDL